MLSYRYDFLSNDQTIVLIFSGISLILSYLVLNNWASKRNIRRRLKLVENSSNTSKNERQIVQVGQFETITSVLKKLDFVIVSLRNGIRGFQIFEQHIVLKLRQAGIFNATVLTYPLQFIVLVPAGLGLVASGITILMGYEFVTVALIFVSFLILGPIAIYARLKQLHVNRSDEFNLRLTETLNLVLLGLNAGLSIEASIRRMMPELHHISSIVAQEFSVLLAELQISTDRELAYNNLGDRISSETLKSVIIVFVQAETQGSTASASLRSLANDHDHEIVSTLEAKMAQRSAFLSVPLLLFTMPTAFTIIMIEIVVGAFFD